MDSRERREAIERINDLLPSPDEISQDWGGFILDVVDPAAGIWSRKGLSARDRSLATIAVLTATYRPVELKLHIGFGLRNGLTRAEICEVIMHTAVYAGFPSSVEGMRLAKEVFDGGE
jgi:4-carboxymuconolactone decarboxylase